MTVVRAAAASVRVRDARREPPSDWDARTVDPPGGHVLQGVDWAAHRAGQGWTTRFVTFDDDRAALVLTHRQPPLPGFVAYAPRGPIGAGDPPERTAARAAALATWLRAAGRDDPRGRPRARRRPGLRRGPRSGGLPSDRGASAVAPPDGPAAPRRGGPDAVLAGISKQTRQRIRAAEASGTRVVVDASGEHLEAFGRLVDAAAERKRFDFATDRGFLDWWRRVVLSGRARFWVALHDDRLLGGLLAYRQSGHVATAFSADRADLRRELPGTMHLLRWHAIREAVEAGCPSIDLGGVDVRGARRKPGPGDPGYGLYEHKSSFGAEWVESAGAHEIVLRPWVYRTGLLARRARRLVRDRS